MVKEHGVLVVEFQVDSITSEQVLDALKAAVSVRIPETQQAILFDCQPLTGRVTSQFFAALVAIRQQAVAENVLICLCHLSGPLREAYGITQLERIMPVYEDREVAISAVGDLSRRERSDRASKRIRAEEQRRANMTRMDHVREFAGDLHDSAVRLRQGEFTLAGHARRAAIFMGCVAAALLLAALVHQLYDAPGDLPVPRVSGER